MILSWQRKKRRDTHKKSEAAFLLLPNRATNAQLACVENKEKILPWKLEGLDCMTSSKSALMSESIISCRLRPLLRLGSLLYPK